MTPADIPTDGGSVAAETRPNVVLVTLDSFRYDRCGFTGYRRDVTPTLDRLAATGHVFDAAYAPGPRTAESIPGILTGRLSAECSYLQEPSYTAIPGDAETLATWLGEAGYRTAAAVANPHLSPRRGFDRGFERFRNLRIDRSGDRFADEAETAGESRMTAHLRGLIETTSVPQVATRVGYAALRSRDVITGQWPTVPGETVIEEAVDALSADETPLFLWTHLNDLHTPLHPARADDDVVNGESHLVSLYRAAARLNNEDAPGYEHLYDGIVSYLDGLVGQLVTALREQDMWSNTMFIVTADHGEAFRERGYYGHAAGAHQRRCHTDRDYLHAELLHVPLLVVTPTGPGRRWPGIRSLRALYRLIAEVIDLETGAFPDVGAGGFLDASITPADRLAVSDALTENGHTVTVRAHAGTVYTAGTDQDDESEWWYFTPGDRMERYAQPVDDAPASLLSAARTAKARGSSEAGDDRVIDTGIKELLSDLGYR